ncbi:MAG: beta-L-arabinofuranosidase domain-containing protein [Candidatus Omnitrophota bacterium]
MLRKTINVFLFVIAAFLAYGENQVPAVAKEPTLQTHFTLLPLGSVKPKGWLKDQLTVQSNGLTGHLDEFWPSLAKTAWKGMEGGEAWERGPYYLDGLVPLAYLLDDQRLIEKTKPWMEWILSSGQENGWFGPPQNKDRWPISVALKVLAQYYEATQDGRALEIMKNYFHYLHDNRPDWPDEEWRGVRAMENAVAAHWLYNLTGEPYILEAADSIFRHSYDWTAFFYRFPYPFQVLAEGIHYGHPSHIVNLGMAVKYPGLRYRETHREFYKEALHSGLESLEKHHGQVGGRFAGDEHLSGRHPSQGTELCGVVELMFSLENLIAIIGDPAFADRLEMLAYNSLPGTCTPDFWAHQYDQQANQVLCDIGKRQWSTNGDQSNIYGLEPNFGCCTANMHQGWPKFVKSLWMANGDRGLAAIAYGPCEVEATVADSVAVTITEETDYPFSGEVRFVVKPKKPAAFPLQLRIPGWAQGAVVKIGDAAISAEPGTFVTLECKWKKGDVVILSLPMDLRLEHRYNNAVSILRGPIYYSLKIKERYEKIKSYHDRLPAADWAIYPESPWNYALLIDAEENQIHPISIETQAIQKIPFEQKNAPVILKIKGQALPDWKMERNSAAAPPQSPAVSNEPVAELELIPYGCTRLRITEFPYIEGGN